MITIDTIRQTIEKQRYNGASYEAIAREWNIKPAMAEYILTHKDYKPSPNMAHKLGLTPTRKQLLDRARRASRKDELIRLRGENETLRILVNELRLAILCASVCNERVKIGLAWGVPSQFQDKITELIKRADEYPDAIRLEVLEEQRKERELAIP